MDTPMDTPGGVLQGVLRVSSKGFGRIESESEKSLDSDPDTTIKLK
jgi:hypothetical protein